MLAEFGQMVIALGMEMLNDLQESDVSTVHNAGDPGGEFRAAKVFQCPIKTLTVERAVLGPNKVRDRRSLDTSLADFALNRLFDEFSRVSASNVFNYLRR